MSGANYTRSHGDGKMSQHLYQPLNPQIPEIRLLRIRRSRRFEARVVCTLKTHILRDNLRYDALSYAWDKSGETKSILINGCHVSIGASLESALRHLRANHIGSRGEKMGLWVDRLCINQDDDLEKGHQVQMMRYIYIGAVVVHAWLGDGGAISKAGLRRAFDILKQVSEGRTLWEILHREDLTLDLTVMQYLFSLPWWSRVWVTQEVLLAKEPILHCGRKSIALRPILKHNHNLEWKNYGRTIQANKQVHSILKSLCNQTITSLYRFRFISTAYSGVHNRPEWHETVRLLASNRMSESSDPRDMIYGLLGLLPQEFAEKITVDYSKSTADVYTDFALQFLLHYKSLALFNQLSPDMPSTVETIPSWVPHWQLKDDRDDFSRAAYTRFYNACYNRDLQVEILGAGGPGPLVCLRLHGLKFDIISALTGSPNQWDENHPSENTGESRKANGYKRWRRLLAPEDAVLETVSYIGGGNLENAYWRTLLYDIIPGERSNGTVFRRRCESSDYQQYEQWWRDMLRGEVASDRIVEWGNFHDNIEINTYDRNLFKTENGYIGIGNTSLKAGDFLCVIAGGPWIYALRPVVDAKQSNTFTIIGECYVHGVMDGEIVRAKVLEETDGRNSVDEQKGERSGHGREDWWSMDGWEDIYVV